MAKQSFEDKLEKLETLVTQLESGDLSLDASLKQFEAGVKLARDCQTALKNAEQKVSVLLDEDGELTPFDEDE